MIVDQLASLGYRAEGVQSWRDAQAIVKKNEPDLILLDVKLPDADGLKLIPTLSKTLPVVVLTAYGSIAHAVDAIKSGASEYLSKPVNLEELDLALSRALHTADLRHRIQFFESRQEAGRRHFMIGKSAAFREVIKLVEAVAETDTTVLIQGESGVGKEVIAHEIHARSLRSRRPFVTVDCCSLQENLFESELFGHERGSFTGADKRKKGLIEGANGGTLFLDEIGEITAALQAKLLRVIETGQFRRVGGVQDLTADARIVAATNRDLGEEVTRGGFRSDLFYRLTTIQVTVPPLRERREDIADLARHFLTNHDFSRRIAKEFSAETIDALEAYAWPGNVRELRNDVERAIIVSGDEEVIQPAHLGQKFIPIQPQGDNPALVLSFDSEPTLDEMRRRYLMMLLNSHNEHRASIAEKLGISERNLYRLIKKYDFDREADGGSR